MNRIKRTINPLLNRISRYFQSENADLKYSINWAIVLQGDTVDTSTWTAEGNQPTISNEAEASGVTSAYITGDVGEYTIINKIVTVTSGETMERIIKLKIVDNDKPYYQYDYNSGGCW